jgi:proteasome accessory factor A
MRRRAFGLEVEHDAIFSRFVRGTSSRPARWVPLSRQATNAAHRCLLRSSNAFLDNGARFYLDVGAKHEYASPECDEIADLVAATSAGDLYMQKLAAGFPYTDDPPELLGRGPWKVKLYAGNVCNYAGADGEDTYGTHENIQFEPPPGRETESIARFTRRLHAFLAARILVFGAGRLHFDGFGNPYFELSQRAGFIEEVESGATTSRRPLINTRDEPHAKDGTRRWHIICGENSIREEMTGLKFALTCLLLTMEEEGRLRGFLLKDPVEAIRQFSFRPSQKVEGNIEDRQSAWFTPLQILWHYTRQLVAFMDAEGEDQRLKQFRPYLDLWVAHLQRLEQGFDPDLHFGELDWATKIVIVRQKARRQGAGSLTLPTRISELRQAELGLHEVAQPDSPRYIIRRKFPRGTPDPALVAYLFENPPPTTRAAARGTAIGEATARYGAEKVSADWEIIKIADRPAFMLGHPLDPSLPEELAQLLRE